MKKKYNLELRYLKDKEYVDECELVLHAAFEVLTRFVETELKNKVVDWDSSKIDREIWTVMMELYNWWTIVRPARDEEDPIKTSDIKPPDLISEFSKGNIARKKPSKKYDKKYINGIFVFDSKKHSVAWSVACSQSAQWELKCNKEDTDMMIKLAKIHKYMWT